MSAEPKSGDRIWHRAALKGDLTRDEAIERGAANIMKKLRAAGLEPDLSTLKITDHYDEVFLLDIVEIEVRAK